jgi:hypothetical protein
LFTKVDGYIINKRKIQSFLRGTKVKNLSTFLNSLDVNDQAQVEEAMDLVLQLKVEKIALFSVLFSEQKGTFHLAYINARASEDLMFETCYMQSVLGNPPCQQAIDFGLTTTCIEDYKQAWRDLGIDPAKVHWNEQI